jgi:ATP-dependent Clp protease protease subunit
MDIFDPRFPFPAQVQRNRDYMRQRQMGIGDMLLDNRIVFLGTFGSTYMSDQYGQAAISDALANATIQQLLYLQYENRTQEIHFYINSPGGSVTATLAIYDTMQFLECPISTYCVGTAASGAAILLTGGTKGKRFALPHSRIMLHQPWGQVGGQATDVDIAMKEMIRMKEALNRIMARHTGRSSAEIEAEIERDHYFSAEEAKAFGLVDEVLEKPKEKPRN